MSQPLIQTPRVQEVQAVAGQPGAGRGPNGAAGASGAGAQGVEPAGGQGGGGGNRGVALGAATPIDLGEPGRVRAPESAVEQSEVPLPGGGKPLAENFNPEDRSTLAASNKQYAIYKQTFREGVVGKVLQSGARAGEFKTSPAMVPGMVWRPGPAGAAAAAELVGKFGQEKALQLLGDAPALSLRNAAVKDGVLNVKQMEQWQRTYAPVLAKFPELAQRFGTAADAQRTVEAAAVRGQQAIDAYQDLAARHYLGKGEAGADPQTAIQKLMASENPGAAGRDLMQRAQGRTAATDGIRRNTLEWLMARAKATAEAGTTGEKEIAGGTFQKLVQDPKIRRGLQAILTPQQMQRVDSVAQDLEMAARAWNAVKVPGSPGTAADLHALQHSGSPSALVQIVLAEKLGDIAGHLAGLTGLWPAALEAAGTVGGLLFNARRAAGLRSVEDLTTAGVLNPALGRVLAQKAIANPRAPILRDMARRIVALNTGIALSTQEPERRQ